MARLFFPLIGVSLSAFLVVLINGQSQSQVENRYSDSATAPYKIFAPGRIEGTTTEVELRPQLRGQVSEVLVREAQIVEQGQILLRLNDEQFQHEVDLAAAEVDLARAQLERLVNGAHKEERGEAKALYLARLAGLERAKLDWQRVERLWMEKVVTEQEIDDHRSRVKTHQAEVDAAKARVDLLNSPPRSDELHLAQSRVAAAQARLALAKVQFNKTRIVAPLAAEVLKVNAEPGELAGPDAVIPVLVLADTSQYRVRAFVEELDAPRIRVGMSAVAIADGLPGRVFQGRVTRLSPRMTSKQIWSDEPTERHDTKAREVWIDLDDGEDLVLGLRMDVIVDPGKGEDGGEPPRRPGHDALTKTDS